MCAADLVPAGITLLSLGAASAGVPPQPFVFSVLNVGDRRAPSGTRVRFYLSRDAVLDSSDRRIRDSVLGVPVRPGERVTVNKVMKFSEGMDDGLFRVIMRIDPGNGLAESDENNNDLHSAPIRLYLQPQIESLDINKRYLRPGSAVTLLASFSLAPSPLTRGATATLTATGLSPDATAVSLYYDSNFDGRLQVNSLPYGAHQDYTLGSSSPGAASSVAFTVPDWFPSAPARVLILVTARRSTYEIVYRTYCAFVSAH